MINGVSTKAALRFISHEASLDFITEALAVSPTSLKLKGQPRSSRSTASGVFEESFWIYDSPLSELASLEEHLERLLAILECNVINLKAFRGRVTRSEIFCMFSSENGQGSLELPHSVCKRLAALEFDLIVDLYPPN